MAVQIPCRPNIPTPGEFAPFRPELQERFLTRFYLAAKELTRQAPPDWDTLVRQEVEWADTSGGNPSQQAMYRAVWLLLRDLLRVGWVPAWNDQTATFEIAPPSVQEHPRTAEEIQAHKQARRDMMRPERLTRLLQAREFVQSMESPARGLPVTALIADGRALAEDLRRVRAIAGVPERHEALSEIIKPYLQLVEDNKRCQHTGLLLKDIWRYFRLTWSSPVYNTPGRSMFYLVRDAARPLHPVMGIASLENSPIFIGARDDLLGWTVDSFIASLERETAEAKAHGLPIEAPVLAAFHRLLSYIRQASGEISLDQLCTVAEVANPTPAVVRHLTGLAGQFASEREDALREWTAARDQRAGGNDSSDLKRSSFGNISEDAYDLLFLKKRSGELARLLGARLTIEQFLAQPNVEETWRAWCDSERGRSAVRNGLLSIKNRHVGTSILELNVCGAIPPYNHLLAGKLTALLMCSPQVASDYRTRYGSMPSEIASQLRGERVIRPAELVYIGTTALYTAGASQYNRLRLPAGLLREDAPETPIRYLGTTVGYGTAHISDATTAALEMTSDGDFLQVNHVLGEGVSPKMRIIRRGLDAIFRDGQRVLSDKMAQHQMQRLIYGVWLAENGRDYLLGMTNQPRYIWEETLSPTEGTERIAAFWRARWLDARIRHDPALMQMEGFRVEEILVSRDLGGQAELDWAYTLVKHRPNPVVTQISSDGTQMTADEHQRQLVRDLYRGRTGYADDVSLDDLRRLHLPTHLDAVISEHIRARRSVVLTGNPGDGKTHLLRILEPEIAELDAVVERDASAVPNDVIAENWHQAAATGRPYFIAINESVLFKLATAYPDFIPLQRARQQVVKAIAYDSPPDLPITDVVVFDLSHRNTLSPNLVSAVFDKLTDAALLPRCAQCPRQGCDRERNRILLQGANNRIRERLQAVFSSVTRRGTHVTMRDLEGFVAYLLFANRDCTALLRQSDNADLALPQLPYLGQGPLFDAIRETFDPSRVCHPIFDDALLNNTLVANDWWDESSAYTGSLDAQAVERFARRKREFYFYHRQGDALLQMANDDEQAFTAFLVESDMRKALRSILQKLTAFFGRVADADRLPVWQSHRYDQSAQRILYAIQNRERKEFELLRPQLAKHMAAAFDLADDHRLLRLKSSSQASLRIDFRLFRLLHQAERGLPVLLLQPEATRRIWQFLEQLPDQRLSIEEEAKVQILDPVTGGKFDVTVDTQTNKYLAIERRER